MKLEKLDISLDDWQEEALEHKGNLLLCTGRQVGKTTVLSLKAAIRMISQKNCSILVISLTEDQAKIIIDLILDFLEILNKPLIKQGLRRPTRDRIQLKNGSQVRSRAVGLTGKSIRGFTGHVLIVDEASRMGEEIWSAARPTLLMTAGEQWLCSTPAGKEGYFWECFNNKEDFHMIYRSSEEVVRNRKVSSKYSEYQREMAINHLEREKKSMTKVRYGQEYQGLFLDEINRYFPDEIIKRACTIEKNRRIEGHDYALGVDIARQGKDSSAFVILDITNLENVEQVEVIITKRTFTTETTEMILLLEKKYDFKHIGIDSTGIGAGVLDQLMLEESTRRKTVALENAKKSLDYDETTKRRLLKEDMYDNLLRKMIRGEMHLLDDPRMVMSLRSILFDDTDDSRFKISGKDSHVVEATIRAAHFTNRKVNKLWVTSIPI